MRYRFAKVNNIIPVTIDVDYPNIIGEVVFKAHRSLFDLKLEVSFECNTFCLESIVLGFVRFLILISMK